LAEALTALADEAVPPDVARKTRKAAA